MNARKAGFIVAAALACGCAWAGPPVEATLTLGNDTEGIASDPVLAQTYVTNQADGTVSVINMNTRTVVATIHAGTNPHRIIADAATHRVYLTNATTPGTVTVIDGTKNAVVATIAVGNDPEGIGSNLFIGHVYVSNNGSNSVSVINTASNAVVATIPVGTSPLSPNSNDILKKLYVASFVDNTVSVIDEQALALIKTVPVGSGPGNAAIDAQHAQVYVNNQTGKTVSVISSTTDTVIATVPSGQSGTGATGNFAQISTVYHRAYLPNAADGTMTIINTDTNMVTHTLMLGTTPVDAIVDANGGNVYVVNRGSNSVSILNAGTETVIDSLSVGVTPWRADIYADNTLANLLVLNTNGSSFDSVTIAAPEDTLPQTEIATEFFEANFNHYFHTAFEVEARQLVDGVFGDAWHRTFEFWRVWSQPGAGRVPVSRYFSTAFGALSSHFYCLPDQCAALEANPAQAAGWQLETAAAYYLEATDASGNCPAGTAPLYRVYNNGMGGAPNHRYTADPAIRALMITQGWVAEGNGPDIIFACTPTLLNG